MKKIIIFLLFGLVLFCGCESGGLETDIRHDEIQEVVDLIATIPTALVDTDKDLLTNIRNKYDTLTEAEKELVNNYATLEEAEAIMAIIETTKREALDAFVELKEYLNGIIPDEVTNGLDLPRFYEYADSSVNLYWTTSDRYTLSTTGTCCPGREDIKVTLSATFAYGNYNDSYTKEVTVKGLGSNMKDLTSKKPVFAYMYRSSGYIFSDTAIETIDVMNMCFATVSASGVISDAGELALSSEAVRAKKAGIRILFSIGGYGAAGAEISNAASTKEGREKLAKSIVDIIEKYHYDGVDVDWEYPGFETGRPTEVDKPNYTLLIAEIKKQLKAANTDYLLTAALPAGPWSYVRYELDKIGDILDYLHLMTYDMDSSGKTTHHSALYSSTNTVARCSVEDSITIYTDGGFPKEKIVVGAAFYGRKLVLNAAVNADGTQSTNIASRASITYSSIKKDYLDRIGTDSSVVRYWDDVAKAPYIYDSVEKVWITYDDAESIALKCQYVKDNNLGGMMFWEFGQDSNGILLEAIYNNLVKK